MTGIHQLLMTTFAAAGSGATIEYLIIAGAGGAGGHGGAGSGAGGYRSSVIGETSGGPSTIESALAIETGISYVVTVGAGGPGGTNTIGQVGGNSSLNNTAGGG